MNVSKRLRELDFLRGIAIILVLLRHIPFSKYTTNMGWIGVDLFFVLSGFLVSGLLFKEFIKHGNFNGKLFLIRRGFKIYPLYYLAVAGYTIFHLVNSKFYLIGFLSELIFFQNYATVFGWSFIGSWSLAVEEHFYFGLVIVLFVLLKKKWLTLKLSPDNGKVELGIIILMSTCLLLRIISNLILPIDRNFTMTHLRIDSLLAGVLVSYLYHFKNSKFSDFVRLHQGWLMPVSFLLLSFAPIVNDPIHSLFVKTIGFSMLYVAFGIWLSFFLVSDNINEILDRFLSRKIVTVMSRIGVYSYSIYLVHIFVIEMFQTPGGEVPFMQLVISFLLSIFCGLVLSITIEKFFLRIRDHYFPGRS